MTKKEQNEGEISSGDDVINIYDKLTEHSFALKAFSALLKSSDLADFADQPLSDYIEVKKDIRAAGLRDGLSQIIELYLAHQERILSESVEAYYKSDAYLFQRARGAINCVKEGAYISREVEITHLRDAIANLDIVIGRHGEQEEDARLLRDVCLNYIFKLTGKKVAGV